MIARKHLSLADLAETEVLYIHELSKVIVVGKNKDLMFATFWIMPPYFEGLNNCQKLTIMSFVSSFGRNHFIQKVGQRMPLV